MLQFHSAAADYRITAVRQSQCLQRSRLQGENNPESESCFIIWEEEEMRARMKKSGRDRERWKTRSEGKIESRRKYAFERGDSCARLAAVLTLAERERFEICQAWPVLQSH